MSAAARPPARDPASVARELAACCGQGRQPRLLVLAPPARGEEEPWFAEQVLGAARAAARARPELDLLDLDGAGDALPVDALDAFLQAASLFGGGERALLLARAGAAFQRLPRLADSLARAALDPGGPCWMIVQLAGKAATDAVKTLEGALRQAPPGTLQVERFRRLYGDPPPWRPHDLDASEAAQFVSAEARERGLRLLPGAAGCLVEIAGARPGSLVQALEHFQLLGRHEIDEDAVRETVARSAEGSAFQFAAAILEGDGAEALRLLAKIRARGLQAWNGQSLGPQEAFSLLLSVLASERRRTEGVRRALDRGLDPAAALRDAGVAAAGPMARRMEQRARACDDAQLRRVLAAARRAERRLKVEGMREAGHALEELALAAHRRRPGR